MIALYSINERFFFLVFFTTYIELSKLINSQSNYLTSQLALNIWRDEMLNMIHPVLVKAILQDITRDRAGVSLYPNLLRDVIHSFVEVRIQTKTKSSRLSKC